MKNFLFLFILVAVPFFALAQESGDASAEVQAPESGEDAATDEQAEKFYYQVAVLQGLNKVTARISELKAPAGTSVRFGNLEIIVQQCWQSPPTERPENAILVEIWERRTDEPAVQVFHGWMFSSSPSLSGLEHPVYDIVALRCDQQELGADDV